MSWFNRAGSRAPATRVPPRRTPRPGRPGPPGGEGIAKFLPFVVLGLLGAAAIWFWTLVPEVVQRDPDTLCPVDGPDSVTVILVDTTGNYDGITQGAVFAELEQLLDDSTVDDMFVVFNMRGDNPEAPDDDGVRRWSGPETVLRVCNPGDPGDTNPLFQNPDMIERALNEKYLQPIRETIADLVRIDALADFSPLIESVQVVEVGILSLPDYAALPRRLVLVTDLIQNSASLTFNRAGRRSGGGPPPWEDFSGTPEARALGANLAGVDVEILFHERREHETFGDRGARDVIDWWDRWFDAQGASVSRVTRLTGRS